MKFLAVFLIVVLVTDLIAAEVGSGNKKNRVCGLQSATPRLSNGNLMPIESYPWTVAVYTRFGNRTRYCSGAFITSSHVLTAAHCFGGKEKKGKKPAKITISYGSATPRQGTRMQVMGYYIHEDFGRLLNDIAILLLPVPVNVTQKSRPICLPESPSDVPGTRAIVTGWGTVKKDAEELKRALTSLHKDGKKHFELLSTSQVLWSTERCRVTFPSFDPQRQICAKVANTGPCK
ncbi:hypothetical protein HPB47_003481, partial [Ixodes persulcatus]